MTQPEVASPVQRTLDEMQHAHDLLVFLITKKELRTLLSDEALTGLATALNVLCWALRHDDEHGSAFGTNLAALERWVTDIGYEAHFVPEARHPKADPVPPIERMASQLAETCLERDRLKKTHGALVQAVGNRGVCKRCGREIYWVRLGAEPPALYDLDGVSSHLTTCPDRQANVN